MRLISSSLGVATLVFSLFSLDSTAAYECPSSCGTPSSLAFCDHISWATCHTTRDWEQADRLAQQDYLNFLKARGYDASSAEGVNATISTSHGLSVGINSGAPTAALGAHEGFVFTDDCLRALRLLHCSAYFPVCEIGMEAQPICEGECEDSMTALCGLPAEDPETLDATCKPLYSSKGDEEFQIKGSQRSRKCTKLDYDGPAMGMWVAGFLISLIFSVLAALGINMQKYSLTKYERMGMTHVPPFKQPFWILGFILILSGSILDFVAFGLAPQTLLAPLAALSLVWNMILAPLFHNEKVTRQNIVATVVIFIGVTATVIFAGPTTPSYDLDDLIMLYEQPIMYFYIAAVSTFLVALFVTAKVIESKLPHLQNGFVHIICYGGMAGTFGGQSVLLAKSTVELVKSVLFDNTDAFTRLPTYIIISTMATTLILQMSFLNEGLKRFDALLMVPVYQSFWIIMSVLGGIMYFEEYTTMTYTQTIMFPVGSLITLLGIIILLQDRIHPIAGAKALPTKYSELSQASTADADWDCSESDDEESTQKKLDDALDEGDEKMAMARMA